MGGGEEILCFFGSACRTNRTMCGSCDSVEKDKLV
jgi:hypothetical protein